MKIWYFRFWKDLSKIKKFPKALQRWQATNLIFPNHFQTQMLHNPNPKFCLLFRKKIKEWKRELPWSCQHRLISQQNTPNRHWSQKLLNLENQIQPDPSKNLPFHNRNQINWIFLGNIRFRIRLGKSWRWMDRQGDKVARSQISQNQMPNFTNQILPTIKSMLFSIFIMKPNKIICSERQLKGQLLNQGSSLQKDWYSKNN